MPKWNEGDRVRVVTRPVTEDDRKTSRYFSHMAGVTGTIENVFGDERVSVKVDPSSAPKTTRDVHGVASERVRQVDVPQGLRRALTKEELEFTPNLVFLLETKDLEKL